MDDKKSAGGAGKQAGLPTTPPLASPQTGKETASSGSSAPAAAGQASQAIDATTLPAVRNLPPIESLELIPEVEEKELQQVERLAVETGILSRHIAAGGGLMLQMRQGLAMQRLESMLTNEIMDKYFMPLQGSPLGFKTDRDKDGGYPVAIVRKCVVHAAIHGMRVVNNEMNILGGGGKTGEEAGFAYGTVEFFKRIVPELEGVRDLSWSIGLPENAKKREKTDNVRVVIRWTYKPVGWEFPAPMFIDHVFPVRKNVGMMDTATQSKALRAALKMVHQALTGGELTPPEGDVEDPIQIGSVSGGGLDALAEVGDQFIPMDTIRRLKQTLETQKVQWTEFLEEAAKLNNGQIDVNEIPVGLLPQLMGWTGDRAREAAKARRAAQEDGSEG